MIACLLATGVGIMAGRVKPTAGFFFVLKYFEYFIVFFMVANHLETRQQLKRFLYFMLLTCLIVSIIGIIQIPAGGRVSAPFEGESGEPNTFGGYLVFMGALAAGILPAVSDGRARLFLILVLLFIIPPFLFTESRSSYLAAIPAILTAGFLANRKVIVLGFIAVLLLMSPFILPSNVIDRITYTFKQAYYPGQQIEIAGIRFDTSTTARLRSWQEGLRDWTNHPILGHGVTGYAFMDAQYPKVLVETGILGLAAFLYILYSIFKMALENLRQLSDPFYKVLVKGFIAGYVGLLVHAIGANTFIIVRLMEPFWFVVGMLVVLPQLQAAEESDDTMDARHATASVERQTLTHRLPAPFGGHRLFP